jgi:hypothetical protein
MKNIKRRFIFASIVWTLIMMWLAPYGSFNPFEVGFYTSIMAGLMFYLVTYHAFKFLLNKQHK